MRRSLMLIVIALVAAAVTGCAASDGLQNANKLKNSVVYAKDVVEPMTRYAEALEKANPDGSMTPAEAARLKGAANTASQVQREMRNVEPPDHLVGAHAQLVRSIGQSAQALQRMSIASGARNQAGYQRWAKAYATSEEAVGKAVERIVEDSGIPIPEPTTPAGTTTAAP